MNLQKLFKAQAELDKHIIEKKGLQGVNLLPNLILALQVELGECANEWRGFKHWSNDQEPRTEIPIDCSYCYGKGYMNHDEVFEGGEPWPCKRCDGSGVYGYKNPLLEEYVDCLHFILSIGNRLGLQDINPWYSSVAVSFGADKLTMQWQEVFECASTFRQYTEDSRKAWYEFLFSNFLGLGEMLGFTWEQVEQAYFAKNAVNHSRQENGY
ncbi:dUTP diphosphatase [Heyndrickxia coagulans]